MTKEQALDAVEKAIEYAYNKGRELPIHSVSDCFSFARYFNEHFEYFDNTDVGGVYKHKSDDGLYSEEDIFDDWFNNR
jgi:hypothetical protein